MIRTLLVASFLLACAGCADQPSDQQLPDAPASPPIDVAVEPTVDPAPVPDSTVFTQMIVSHDADGAEHIVRRPITAGEQRARVAARLQQLAGVPSARPLIDVDGACDVKSFWLFDRMDYTGDEICIHGRGVINLKAQWLYRCNFRPQGNQCWWTTWAIKQGSYLAGESLGGLGRHQAFNYADAGEGEVDRNFPYQFVAWDRQLLDLTEAVDVLALDH
jgi:hypothetical protein